jgi:hypothetical protein
MIRTGAHPDWYAVTARERECATTNSACPGDGGKLISGPRLALAQVDELSYFARSGSPA